MVTIVTLCLKQDYSTTIRSTRCCCYHIIMHYVLNINIKECNKQVIHHYEFIYPATIIYVTIST